MIDKSLKDIWARAAYEYIIDDSRRYRGAVPGDWRVISYFLENLLDGDFRQAIDKRNLYDDAVEEKVERIFNEVLTEETGNKMNPRKAMAEALKVTYSMGLNLK